MFVHCKQCFDYYNIIQERVNDETKWSRKSNKVTNMWIDIL